MQRNTRFVAFVGPPVDRPYHLEFDSDGFNGALTDLKDRRVGGANFADTVLRRCPGWRWGICLFENGKQRAGRCPAAS